MPSEWYQQALTSPAVLEVNIRVGLIPSQDHLQVLVEMSDPTTSVLLAQWSRPHSTMRDAERAIDDAMAKAIRWIEDACDPF